MEILLAEHMGFCGGVDRAIRITEAALDKAVTPAAGDKDTEDTEDIKGPVPAEKLVTEVWAVGPIIHNEIVMKGLRAKGLQVAGSLDEAPDGATVVVRSHGEEPVFFDIAAAKGLNVIDATCPKVARIHKLVSDADARGEHVVIVGDENHPEVRATKAWGGGERASVIGSLAEVVEKKDIILKSGKPLFIVSQTTFDKEVFEEIAESLCRLSGISNEDKSKQGEVNPAFNINNTICDATALRQDACRELAEKVDCVVVVGDKLSSNTKKLYEIAKNYGKKRALFIENKNEFSLKHLYECGRFGVTAGASTPKQIIEEVISLMSEFKSDNYETNPMHEFMDEIDKSTRLPRNGDIVTGEVIQVTDSEVTVNLGCKKDGVIPKNEIGLEEGQTLQDAFKEGDEVQAKVMKNDDGDGNILLSKKRVVVSEHWETISQAYEEKTPIEVKVTREVSGGVIAMFNEVGGFIPLSQLSDRYVEKAEEFVGQTLSVKVIRLDQKRNKVVFSHKAVLNEERQKRMQEIWDQLSVGDVIDGRVMRFTDYGAFVDIGGVDGLLHISEISWGKLRHPSDLLEIDQEIKVKILSMNKEKEKISLGYKQNRPEPWSVINDKYQVGQVIHGKAVQIKDYGVFVELEPGLDGLVHISEIAYRRVTDISEELEIGKEVSAKILEIDTVRKRISLSIKETLDKSAAADVAETAPTAEEPVDEVAAEDTEVAPDTEAAVEEVAAEDTEAASVTEAAEEEAVEDAPAAEAAEEEAAVEDAPAAEAVVEEAVVEDASVAEEETAVEDAPADEAVVEEVAAEDTEAAPEAEAVAEEAAVEDASVAEEEAVVEDAPTDEIDAKEAVEDAPATEAAEEEAVEDAQASESAVEEAEVEDTPATEADAEEAAVEDAPATETDVDEVAEEDAPAVEETPAETPEEIIDEEASEKEAAEE